MSRLKAEKARRMELRRDIGNRKLPLPPPPRGSHPKYLVAHACFECRRSMKVVPRPADQSQPRCPECGAVAYWMGRTFRAPRRDNLEQWAKVMALYAHGFRFVGSGSHSDPPMPKRLREVEGFVRANPKHRCRVGDVDPRVLSAAHKAEAQPANQALQPTSRARRASNSTRGARPARG